MSDICTSQGRQVPLSASYGSPGAESCAHEYEPNGKWKISKEAFNIVASFWEAEITITGFWVCVLHKISAHEHE